MNCNGQLISKSTPLVMGILNITPDSFYTQSRVGDDKDILLRVEQMIGEGVDIVDVGAVSTRPFAKEYASEEEEFKRIIPAVKEIKKRFPQLLLSVDTFRSRVAKEMVVNYNVGLINDISGGTLDEKMFNVVASLQVPYILTHFRGEHLQSMAQATQYKDLMADILTFFSQKIQQLSALGVNDIIIDPGFGFSKTIEQNYELLHKLSFFSVLDKPIMVGLSRKSMLYKVLENTPEECLGATTVVNSIALMEGVSILRVHDVKEAKEAIKIFMHYKNTSFYGVSN
jgi:dihydropteroate synthase